MKDRIKTLEFKSGGCVLKGILHLPLNENPPVVIGSHGLEGSKDSAKQQVLSRILPENEIAFFRFDHRGCGESQGDFLTETSLEKRTEDFINAVKTVMDLEITSGNLAVFGSSLGGATCINSWGSLLEMDLNLCGAVICSAPVKSRSIKNLPVQANENRDSLPLSFFKNNLDFDIIEKAKNLFNILIFHGDADKVVPVENAEGVYEHAGHTKKIIIQKNGGHQMENRQHQIQFETEALKWFKKYLKGNDHDKS